MKTYIILENGIKTNSKVLASDKNSALNKSNELNKKHKIYSGMISVVESSFK